VYFGSLVGVPSPEETDHFAARSFGTTDAGALGVTMPVQRVY
jgi:hypothetical protein